LTYRKVERKPKLNMVKAFPISPSTMGKAVRRKTLTWFAEPKEVV